MCMFMSVCVSVSGGAACASYKRYDCSTIWQSDGRSVAYHPLIGFADRLLLQTSGTAILNQSNKIDRYLAKTPSRVDYQRTRHSTAHSFSAHSCLLTVASASSGANKGFEAPRQLSGPSPPPRTPVQQPTTTTTPKPSVLTRQSH